MRKYFRVIRASWENSFVYRLNFIMWRMRVVLGLLTGFFLWKAIFSDHNIIFGYQESQMLTYIIVATLIQSVVLSSRSIDLANIINSGDLSNLLIKPINNLKYWFSQDIADKILNIIFSFGELTILFLLLRPAMILPSVVFVIPLTLVVLPISTLLYYFINYLFGLLGFWTPQVWAPRFVLMVLLMFVAGNTFPLDVLPIGIQKFLNLTPFPYLVYFPTQIYLGKVELDGIFKGSTVAIIWTVTFYFVVKYVWKKGLRAYGAEGK